MLLELCSAGGLATLVWVMPDPNKDIGFNIIARFHMHPPVKVETHESMAEAISSLAEHLEPAQV